MAEQEIDNWLNMNQQQPVQLATQEAYWQQVRIQAAIAAMNGYQSAPIIPGCDPNPTQQEIAKWSVQLADALVAELQKKDDNANIQQ